MRIIEKENGEIFVNFYDAAWLRLHGFKLKRLWRCSERRILHVFDNTAELQECLLSINDHPIIDKYIREEVSLRRLHKNDLRSSELQKKVEMEKEIKIC